MEILGGSEMLIGVHLPRTLTQWKGKIKGYVYRCTWVILLKFQMTYPNLTFRSSTYCQIQAVQFLRHKCSYCTIIELTKASFPARVSGPHGKPHPIRVFRYRRSNWTPQAFWLGWVSPVYIPTTALEKLFKKIERQKGRYFILTEEKQRKTYTIASPLENSHLSHLCTFHLPSENGLSSLGSWI